MSEVTSITNFWGSFWQQILHEVRFVLEAISTTLSDIIQPVLTYSRWLIAFFGVPRHGTAAYAMHLSTGFFISGIFHLITLGYTASYPPQSEKFAKIMFFFMMQPVGIFFEQWVKSIFQSKLNLDGSAKSESKVKSLKSNARRPPLGRAASTAIGYIWVLSFLFVTGWPFLDVYFQIGMADWDVPFSFVALLMNILGLSRR